MRAFRVEIADEAIADLRARLCATRWIGDAVRDEPGYGATLGFVQGLCAHWLERFDWRAVEARINAQPNFTATIDGLDLHFIHRRSSRPDAIPLLLIHGWPSSVLEFLDVAAALAEPEDETAPAFHVVVPSLPGYAFSETRPGLSPRGIAAMFAELMTRLGYARFIAQGGNWGSTIGTEMAREWPERVIGLHLNAINGSPPPAGEVTLSAEDQALADVYVTLLGYPHFNLLARAPLSAAHALNDFPAGLAGWIGEKLRDWADTALTGNPGLAPDWMVATAALYWFTGTIGSASALYREAVCDPLPERFVTVPTGVLHLAAETVIIPRPWAERHYAIAHWTRHARGGHYAAIEVPDLFVEDVRCFARMLCGNGKTG